MKNKHTCDGPPGPNRYPFAPGVIDGPAPITVGDLLADLVVAVIALAAVAAVPAVVGFATGYLSLGVF